MQPLEIKAQLKTKGYSIAMIARALGKSPTTISSVINRYTTSVDVAEKLSKILDKPLIEVFPDVETYARAHSKEQKQAELEQLLAS
ncbi:MAG: transcriptional regulator [Rheinheimera sp.]|nr:transcriptional regulator [Rheinheimera sp.]|tara:strand:+ start:9581 stop:9838 length:258 start_codon:yes stop_codon:yes gene_type:complete